MIPEKQVWWLAGYLGVGLMLYYAGAPLHEKDCPRDPAPSLSFKAAVLLLWGPVLPLVIWSAVAEEPKPMKCWINQEPLP